MAHSSVITELLHKLSKNEFLAQDGGNRRHYNKANGYRNQLNRLYGGGEAEEKMTNDIIDDIDTLVPLSVLEQFVKQSEQQMSALVAEKSRLETQLAAVRASGEAGDAKKNEEITNLKSQLERVQAGIAELTGKLANTERQLTEKDTEINNLKKNIQQIRDKVNLVKVITVDSDPVKALLERLKATAPAPGPAAAAASP